MRGKPLNLQGEGEFGFSSCSSKLFIEGSLEKWKNNEPTSVLDPRRSPSPSPPTSTSSSSSSLGVVASVQQKWEWSPQTHHQQEENSSSVVTEQQSRKEEEWDLELQPMPPTLESVVNGAEDWDNMLTESGGVSLGQGEHSLLGWIMGEVEDPSSGLKQLLQNGGGGLDFQNTAGFGMVDPSFGFEALGGGGGGRGGSMAAATMNFGNINPSSLVNSSSCFPSNNNSGRVNSISNKATSFTSNNNLNIPNSIAPPSPNNNPLHPSVFYNQQQQLQFEGNDMKPHSFNSNQNQTIFVPLSYTQQEQQLHLPPQQVHPHQLQFSPHSIPNRPTLATKLETGEELLHQQHQQQQVLVDQLFKVAELVETGNLVQARGILARLNHQLSPVGKPLQRAAFLFKEALQVLLTSNNEGMSPPQRTSTPLDVVLKINAYKNFSEVSPLLQFSNFTCNQVLLEALENYSSIHIVDFDIGFGGQWASFMQEIRMRIGGIALLKITAFISQSFHDPLELNLTRENLSHFANELGIPFELNLVSFDSFNPASWSIAINVSENEAVAVNLSVGGPSSQLSSLPLVLRLVKQLSPKIVVSVDRGCDRSDLPFSHYFLHSLQSCSILLDSLDAVNVNPDIVNKIEKFYLLPTIEKTLLGCQQSATKLPPWRSLFTSAGFSPITFSNFTETQAEYVLKRLPVRGFHVEKHHVSLLLCWQRRELASVSAWRC